MSQQVLKYFLSFLLSLFCIGLAAQDISVTEFRLAENDLTANGRDAVLDQNGDKCALIRIQTTQKGFQFGVGSSGITKVDDHHVGEIWLWVPYGIRHISIHHQQLGSLPNYDFPISIQKARTYIMKITHDQVFVTNYDDTKKQKLHIKIVPQNSSLILNGMSVQLDDKGEASLDMAYGQFAYKVESKGYYPKEGIVVVNDTSKELRISDLNLIMGKVSVHPNPITAEVLIDGHAAIRSALEPIELRIGEHLVTVKSKGYRTENRVVKVTENTTTDVSVSLSQVADYTFTSSPRDAIIYVNKERLGTAPCIKELTTGTYTVKATKPGYKDYNKTLQLNSSNPNVQVLLSKIYNYKNEIYVEGNFKSGGFTSLGVSVGGFFHNVNIEASYMSSSDKSEKIFWNSDKQLPKTCEYSPSTNLSFRLGYGIPIATRFRLTPQIGVNFTKLKENKLSTENDAIADGAYVMSGAISARFSAAIINHLAISVVPEYSFAMNKSKGYETLSSVSPKIKKWGEGLNIKLGITVFF